MKRYWKILTVSFATVIVLGAFYIQSSLAAETVTIEFEKISGDESLVDNLVMNANYVAGDIHQTLLVSNEETIILSNQSLFQQLTRLNMEAPSQRLIEEYKQFMRGKNVLTNSFYEDEHLLVYADIEGSGINGSFRNALFTIDVLDKKSEESTAMKVDLPKKESYTWVNIADIQIVDTQLKVSAWGSRIEGGEDLIVYTIDLKDQKITNEEVIYSTPEIKNGWSEFRILNDYYSFQPEKYLLIKAVAYEHSNGSGDSAEIGEPKALAKDVIIYDIETNKKEKLDVPEEIIGSLENSTIVNSTVFIPIQTPNEVEIIQYDIEAQQWDENRTFAIEQSKDAEHAPFVKLQDGKIYIVSATDEGHTLLIGDPHTGETLYEGNLKVKNQKNEQKDYQLYIFEIE